MSKSDLSPSNQSASMQVIGQFAVYPLQQVFDSLMISIFPFTTSPKAWWSTCSRQMDRSGIQILLESSGYTFEQRGLI